jgi:CRP/FNR family transcriptional regulator
VGVVMQGHVRAVHFGTDGRPVTVLMAWPSEPIGLMAALADDQYGTTLEAAENGTAIAMFPADAFRRLMADEPSVMMSVINELARQMTDMVTMVKTLSADVPARVAIYIGLLLEEQAPAGPAPYAVDLGVPRVELAARLGTVPETLSRAFHVLQRQGIIESRGQRVLVRDRDALIARSNGVL